MCGTRMCVLRAGGRRPGGPYGPPPATRHHDCLPRPGAPALVPAPAQRNWPVCVAGAAVTGTGSCAQAANCCMCGGVDLQPFGDQGSSSTALQALSCRGRACGARGPPRWGSARALGWRYVRLSATLLCTSRVPQGTHRLYKDPDAFQPQRFMPGGEYDQFDDSERAYMFLPFIQVRACVCGVQVGASTASARGFGVQGSLCAERAPPSCVSQRWSLVVGGRGCC